MLVGKHDGHPGEDEQSSPASGGQWGRESGLASMEYGNGDPDSGI